MSRIFDSTLFIAYPKAQDLLALGDRLEELSAWESRLALRSRLVPDYIRLVFRSQPTSCNDAVGELDTRYDGSAEFSILRNWLLLGSEYLHDLPLIGHRDADGQLLALHRKFDEQLARLEKILVTAWTREVVARGLLLEEVFMNSPVIVSQRKPISES